MCGIFAIFGLPEPGVNWREEGLRNNSKCSFFYVIKSIDILKILVTYGPYDMACITLILAISIGYTFC